MFGKVGGCYFVVLGVGCFLFLNGIGLEVGVIEFDDVLIGLGCFYDLVFLLSVLLIWMVISLGNLGLCLG